MNDEQKNNAQVKLCIKCKKNPCVCIPEKSDKDNKAKENQPRTKPPKICWI